MGKIWDVPGKTCDARKTQLTIIGFENGRGRGAKKFRQPLESGKSKKMDCLLEPLEEASLADILNLAQCQPK